MGKYKMKRQLKELLFLLILFFFISGCGTMVYQNTTPSAPPAYNIADLNNYGEWVQTDNFGEAWHPYVTSDWAPYDNGHWSYINGYWTWVSYEPFGWIVYHYGYWYYDSFYGWVWIPSDNNWSPANVIWNDYGDYVSWAPLPPRGVSYGHPWEMNQRRYWHVVKMGDFTKDNVGFYRVGNPTVGASVSRDFMGRAPERQSIEKATGKPVRVITSHRSEVKSTNKRFERIELPQPERQKVEQNTERVKKEVLVPRDQFRNRENEKKQQPQRQRKEEPKKDGRHS
jgi:Family of unknown function (DUF6600)